MDASLQPGPTRLLKPWIIVSTFGLPLVLVIAFFISSFTFGHIAFVTLVWILIGTLQTLLLSWVDTTAEERLLNAWWCASLIGGLLAVCLLLIWPIIGLNDNDYRTGVLLWSGMALIIGITQWFVLRHYVVHAWLWIPVMALAGFLTALGVVFAGVFGILSIFIMCGLTGLLTGVVIDGLLHPLIPDRL